ncbi:MAG: MerR family transcriptional regulator, partial [Steroidobacteraceae bacterium]
GLLRPAAVGANGYRYYGQDELLRLQHILLHRELGLPLDAIAALLESADGDRIQRLREHRQQLLQRMAHYRELIATLDRTIAELEGERAVNADNLYKGFSPARQAEYEDWIVKRYSSDERSRRNLRDDMDRSRQHVHGFGKQELVERTQALAGIEAALADHCRMQTAADDPRLNAVLALHREWVAGMWGKQCPPDAYAGLADLYESHPDFRARYELLAAGLSDYLPAAMRAYSRNVST